MSDLISRSAAIEALDQHSYENGSDYDKTVELLNELPAVDAVPVVHARWIYSGEVDEDGNCEANCSRCGAGDKHRADLKDAVPYCWKCGARMDGEADG